MKKPLFLNHIILVSILSFLIMLASVSSSVLAAEQRHHDAHVHGIAHLNVAMEGTSLHLEFTSPAANIVGFEHEPRTPEQKEGVRNAIEKLENGSTLFILSPGAQCRLSKFSVKTDIEHDADHDDDHDADHDEEHEADHDDDHNANAGHKHEHENDAHHGEGEDKDQEHHDDKDQDHHDENEEEHARHSEFHSEYRFVCKNPGKLSQMDVMLIQSFPGIEHIEVQLLTETKQTALELTAQSHRIRF